MLLSRNVGEGIRSTTPSLPEHVEVTVALPENEHLYRENIRKTGGSFAAVGITRFRCGLVSEKELRQDKNMAGIKFWLWYMHHPPHEVWKKVGRPYWSVEAYASWKRAYFALPEANRVGRDARPSLASIPRRAAAPDWLVHEHVVPQKVLLDLLITKAQPVAKVLDLNMGAVITRREDRLLPTISSHPDAGDPWRRYAGTGITFIPNPAWSRSQRTALERHDLIAAEAER